jgi:hypothetical protein
LKQGCRKGGGGGGGKKKGGMNGGGGMKSGGGDSAMKKNKYIDTLITKQMFVVDVGTYVDELLLDSSAV